MWCGETRNESQRKYSEKLRHVIKEIFAHKEAVPVVQCMNGDLTDYEPNDKDNSIEAERLRKRIRQISGWDDKLKDFKFKHMLYTRDQVHKNHNKTYTRISKHQT